MTLTVCRPATRIRRPEPHPSPCWIHYTSQSGISGRIGIRSAANQTWTTARIGGSSPPESGTGSSPATGKAHHRAGRLVEVQPVEVGLPENVLDAPGIGRWICECPAAEKHYSNAEHGKTQTPASRIRGLNVEAQISASSTSCRCYQPSDPSRPPRIPSEAKREYLDTPGVLCRTP